MLPMRSLLAVPPACVTLRRSARTHSDTKRCILVDALHGKSGLHASCTCAAWSDMCLGIRSGHEADVGRVLIFMCGNHVHRRLLAGRGGEPPDQPERALAAERQEEQQARAGTAKGTKGKRYGSGARHHRQRSSWTSWATNAAEHEGRLHRGAPAGALLLLPAVHL